MTTGLNPRARAPHLSLLELVWRYRADEIDAADLPMLVADALVAGWDTPALCELAGLPRNADRGDVRELFEHALSEAGVELPAPEAAYRYALRRLATRFVDGEITPTELVASDRCEVSPETAEERAFLALIPACVCCMEYSTGPDPQTWAAELRSAALTLAASPPTGLGC
ncbi:hypothetical protein [Streptomyces sp. SID3343]|uniref:hypothetical protein n=1 Tax=Streptomyces sp. SID3343 TaxID=2690260 RepID=UPI0019266570|nr:hypothetical protein [Streptomyces sp. SID3343]